MKAKDWLLPEEMNVATHELIDTLDDSIRSLEVLSAGEIDMLFSSEGRPILLGSAQDALRRQGEARYAAVLDALDAQVAHIDGSGLIVSVNRAWREFSDECAPGLPFYGLGKRYLDIAAEFHGRTDAASSSLAEGIQAVLDSGARKFAGECRRQSPAGLRWLQVKAVRLEEDLPGAVLIVLDITARKRSEQDLLEGRQRLANMFNSAMDGIVTVDEEQRILTVNAAAERMFGYEPGELDGEPLERLIPAGSRQSHAAAVRQFGQSGISSRRMGALTPVAGVRRSGEEFPVEASISKAHTAGQTFFTAILRDVSERVKAEVDMARLNAELEDRVAEKTRQLQTANAELESFSYSAAHDLRAPLRRIMGFAGLLSEDIGANLADENRRHLELIRRSAGQMANLIDDMLALSQAGRVEMSFSDVDLNDLVREIVAEQTEYEKGRLITWQIDVLPVVRGDCALLRAALANLVANAVKFTRERSPAVVEIGSIPAVVGETAIYVRDNGSGFDPAFVHKLFQPFERLHSQSAFPGTGIGLANVRRIIARHGGRTWAAGQVNGGATFYFSLPQKEAE